MAERNTVQKALVYGALLRLANHPTADMVYDAVHETNPTISRATVYRVLGRLAEKGMILRVEVTGGADHFDHQTHPHYHIFCRRCGRVCDVGMETIAGLESRITDDAGYKVMGYTVLFDGLCPDCIGKGESVERVP